MARGDLIGTSHKGTAYVDVTAPRVYNTTSGDICFKFHPEIPANCLELSERSGDGTLKTYTARYLPPYAALLGFGELLVPAGRGPDLPHATPERGGHRRAARFGGDHGGRGRVDRRSHSGSSSR